MQATNIHFEFTNICVTKSDSLVPNFIINTIFHFTRNGTEILTNDSKRPALFSGLYGTPSFGEILDYTYSPMSFLALNYFCLFS